MAKIENNSNDNSLTASLVIPCEGVNIQEFPPSNIKIKTENKFAIDKINSNSHKNKNSKINVNEIEVIKNEGQIKVKRKKSKIKIMNPRAIAFESKLLSKNNDNINEPDKINHEDQIIETISSHLEFPLGPIDEEIKINLTTPNPIERMPSRIFKHFNFNNLFSEDKSSSKLINCKNNDKFKEIKNNKINTQNNEDENEDEDDEELEKEKNNRVLFNQFSNISDNSLKSNTIASVTTFSREQLIPIKKKEIERQFSFIKVLDKGSFAEVWLAKNKITKENRAIKIIDKTLFKLDENTRKLFQSELIILQQLDHPNIVRFFESYETQSHIFLVFEYLSGKTFAKLLEEKYFSEKEISLLFKQILSALNYCHHKNVINRDIKPSNIMFETKQKISVVKLIDFGHSAINYKNSKIHGIYGTPLYMAPEIIKEKGHNQKCDIWSTGIILYQLLCGKLPFQSISFNILFDQIRMSNFSLEKLVGEPWNNISLNAKIVVSSMLSSNPSFRPSAQELLEFNFFKEISNNIDLSNELCSSIYSNIRQFCMDRSSIKAIKNYVALHSKINKAYKDARKIFMLVDSNGDGKISREEIVEAVDQMNCGYFVSEQSLNTLFDNIDVDKNGFIDYTEFIASAVKLNTYLLEAKISSAFEKLDPNHNGYVESYKLKKLLIEEFGEEEVFAKSIIKILDLKHKEQITLEDFKESINIYQENEEEI